MAHLYDMLYAICEQCSATLNCRKEIEHVFLCSSVPFYATSIRYEMQCSMLEEMRNGKYVCEYCAFECHKCSECEFLVSFARESVRFFERMNWVPTNEDSNWSEEKRRLRQRMIRSDYICELCFMNVEGK